MSSLPTIYVVTGSKHKLASFQRHLRDYDFEMIELDLPEIQSFSAREIIIDKVERAYAEFGKPVVVEDVAAGIDRLNGLPGPFIKFFEQQLGQGALYQLVGQQSTAATITSTIGYYDGENLIITKGSVHGMVVAPRGDKGWGFDCCFLPDGQTKTYGEMEFAEKDAISHRSLSIKALLAKLNQL
ncbi:MAG: non-canonical purine NTP pyrophosphatase [Candidatus Saccharimonadales bacterium]